MLVSVVLPTLGRGASTERCLEALKGQHGGAFEVIVVDDLPSSDLEPRLAPYRTVLDLKYVRHERRRGPGVARNTGARMARGELLAFLDDDVVPTAGWLQSGHALFLQDPDLTAFVGKVTLPPGEARSSVRHVMVMQHGGGFPSCNFWVRMQAFMDLGGFADEFFDAARGIYHYEDDDLALRLLERGGRVIFAPHVVVFHPSHSRSWAEPIKMARKAYFEPLLAKHHPEGYARLRTRRLGPISIRNARTRFRWAIALSFLAAPALAGCGLWKVAAALALAGGAGVGGLFLRKCNLQGLKELGPLGAVAAAFLELVGVYYFVAFHVRGMLKFKRFVV